MSLFLHKYTVTTQRSGFICNGRLSHEFIPTQVYTVTTQRSGFVCNGRLSHEIYSYTSNTETLSLPLYHR